MKPLLTVREAAALLAVKPATIRAWIWRRKIEFVKVSRCVRIAPEAVEKLIASHTVAPKRPMVSGTTSEDED